MLLNSKESEKLFSKCVPVTIKDAYMNQFRTSKLFLTVEWQEASTSIYRQELVITLTDSNDPFFLYHLYLNEDDFQTLKSNQGLLVDFSAFPQKFIDLIELCIQEEGKSTPKFLLTLNINERLGNVATPSELDIVETNPFKHLTHLSLKLIAATESSVKQYLATCFKNLKEDKRQLQNRLAYLEKELQDKLSSCQEILNNKSRELETVRKELSVELSMKESKHARELQEERDRLLSKQRELEDRMEKESKEKEHNLRKQIQQLESRVSCLDTLNRELQDKNCKHDSTIRELRSRILSLEEEARRNKETLHSSKQQNEHLQSEIKEKRSHMCHQKNKIDELEQELHTKKQNLLRLQEQADIYEKQKNSLKEELENLQLQFEMSEKSEKSLKEDIKKSNDIILKLQEEVVKDHEKVKIKTKQCFAHEKNIAEKVKTLQKMKKEAVERKSQLESKDKEIKYLSDAMSTLHEKIATLEKELKTRDNVIKWLNRQLTDNCVVPQYTPPTNLFPSPSSVSQTLKSNSPAETHPTSIKSPVSVSSSNVTGPKSLGTRIESPSYQRNSASPQVRFQITDTTADSAYATSSSGYANQVNEVSPINNHIDTVINSGLDSALNAAFGNSDSLPKHSTAKKDVPKKNAFRNKSCLKKS